MVILLVLWIAAYAISSTPLAKAPQMSSPATTAPSIDLADAAYNVAGTSYILNDGVATVTIPNSSAQDVLRLYQATYGDLKNSGKKDAAAILINETGGSGTFYYLAALFADGSTTPAVLLGDRIETDSIAIHDGTIVVHYKDRTASQPFSTVPSINKVATFNVVNGTLVQQ